MRDKDLALLLLVLVAASAASDDHRRGVLSRFATRATGAVVDIVDPNDLLERIDVNTLVQRIDFDQLLENIDLNALIERIDVRELVERAGIPDIVRESTGELAGSALDVLRRQLVALDVIVGRFTYRLTTRDPDSRPVAPAELEAGSGVAEEGRAQVSGHYAGPISRLVAFMVDLFFVWTGFVLGAIGVSFVLELFVRADLDLNRWRTIAGVVLFVLWAFTYLWTSLALAGRTPGMGIVGIAVVNRQGGPLTGLHAFVRTIVFPLSFLITGLGFLGILISPERRALHDAAAGTVVVNDWGDRPAEMPTPLTRWLKRRVDEETL